MEQSADFVPLGSAHISGSEQSPSALINASLPTLRNHKRNVHTKSRGVIASVTPPVPEYSIKLSKLTPNQQRGLDWLSSAARDKFANSWEGVLSSWGVRPSHKGTCVILPEAWKAMDPKDIMESFQDYEHPTSSDDRATWGFRDHSTTMARAAAWFLEDWPRRGGDLDNFLGCGPFRPMDAFHLCHHDHCLVHITYEGADINQDRTNCCNEARILRHNGADIPEHCMSHSPPCLLQHAALTTFEVFRIQLFVLRSALGVEQPRPLPRPRYYKYPTHETQLPIKARLSAIKFDERDLATNPMTVKKYGKPDLICVFCTCLKAFSSIINLWSHYIRQHDAVSNDERLAEVKRTAALWDTYWTDHSEGGKNSPTKTKLRQVLAGNDFAWEDVLDWGLR